MDFSKDTFKLGEHKDKKVILIQFEYNQKLINDLKQKVKYARWSKNKKSWYLPDLPAVRKQLNLPQENIISKKNNKIHPINREALQNFLQQLELKAYSENTLKLYVAEFTHLLQLVGNYSVKGLTPKKLKDNALYCVNALQMKGRKMNEKTLCDKVVLRTCVERTNVFL